MLTPSRATILTLCLFVTSLAAGCGGAQTTESESAAAEETEAGEPNVDPSASSATEEEQNDARKAAAATGPVGGEATKGGETPDESKLDDEKRFDINAVLKEHRHDLTDCYDEPLTTMVIPDDGFVVKAKFTIEADGSVAGAEVVEATKRFEDAERCFLLNLATIQFPTPPEGRIIETTYPFKIKRKLAQ